MSELLAGILLVGGAYFLFHKGSGNSDGSATTQTLYTDAGLSNGFSTRLGPLSQLGLSDWEYNTRMRDVSSMRWSDNWRGAWPGGINYDFSD